MLRFLTAGESHGKALIAMLDGFPAGLPLDLQMVNRQLRKRQQGYGRGSRQKIEQDEAELLSGVRHGITTGAPISLCIANNDFDNWKHVMASEPVDTSNEEIAALMSKKAILTFRPGHADLPGTIKFKHQDIRNVLERASARETAARTAAGAICRQLLSALEITIASHVVAIGPVSLPAQKFDSDTLDLGLLCRQTEDSVMFCADAGTTDEMCAFVKKAWQDGDSVGGIVEVLVDGLPPGLGSYTQWDRRLDGLLAQAIMSIQAFKAVEIGDGVLAASLPGSQVHDAILPAADGPLPFCRRTNHAGGIEGGMTNGARLRLRAYMKPIPTMRKGLPSVGFPKFQADTAHYERSDVCAVPAASVVAESMVSFVLARALLEKFGGDTIADVGAALRAYRSYCREPFDALHQLSNEICRLPLEAETE